MNLHVPKKKYRAMEKAFQALGEPSDLEDIFRPILEGAARIRKAAENAAKRRNRKPRKNIQKKVLDSLPNTFTHGDLRRKIQEIVMNRDGSTLTIAQANQRAHSYGWQLSKRDKKLSVEGRGSNKIYKKINNEE